MPVANPQDLLTAGKHGNFNAGFLDQALGKAMAEHNAATPVGPGPVVPFSPSRWSYYLFFQAFSTIFGDFWSLLLHPHEYKSEVSYRK